MNKIEYADYYQALYKRIVPKDLIAKTRESVIGHEGSLENFVTALCFGINRCIKIALGTDPRDIPGPSAPLVLGSTGTGKSHSVREIANAVDLKYFSFDVSAMTGEGWRGASMTNYLSEVADYQDAHPGEICLVLFDEFDKAVRKPGPGTGADESFSPERSFLKVLEGGEYTFVCEGQRVENKTVDLDLIVFILGGAFTGVEALVRKRLSTAARFESAGPTAVSSVAVMTKNELRERITIDDIEEWGIMAELCGRIGRIVNFDSLSEVNLVDIAVSQLLPRYNNTLPEGAEVHVSDEAVRLAAERAFDKDKGARAVKNELENRLLPAWGAMMNDPGIVSATLTNVDGKYKIDYVYGDRLADETAGDISSIGMPVKNNSAVRRLARKWLADDDTERGDYPIEFRWLAEIIDGSAMSAIVHQGASDELADILLKGSEWDEKARIAAKGLLMSCTGYLSLFYNDKPQYRNLGYVLNMMYLVPLQQEECTASPLDIVMCGTTEDNGFEGFAEWVGRQRSLRYPELSQPEFEIADKVIAWYGKFAEKSRSMQKLACEVALLRVAQATLDENEHSALEKELKALAAKCA